MADPHLTASISIRAEWFHHASFDIDVYSYFVNVIGVGHTYYVKDSGGATMRVPPSLCEFLAVD